MLNGFFLKIHKFIINKIDVMQKTPHHTALGMAVGVYVAATPTIPFHMVLAVMLASVFRGSKAAAMVGVWISNPITIPVIYIANYKIGMMILGKESSLFQAGEPANLSAMLRVGIDVTVAMVIGGLILGVIPSLLAYFLTRWLVSFLKNH